MDIQIVIRGVEDNGGNLRAFAEDKLNHLIERFQDHVLGVTMRIEDVTGPEKHGVDKRCSIDMKLRTTDVHLKEQGEDFHATIDVAMDRLKAVVSREVGKAKHGIGEG